MVRCWWVQSCQSRYDSDVMECHVTRCRVVPVEHGLVPQCRVESALVMSGSASLVRHRRKSVAESWCVVFSQSGQSKSRFV